MRYVACLWTVVILSLFSVSHGLATPLDRIVLESTAIAEARSVNPVQVLLVRGTPWTVYEADIRSWIRKPAGLEAPTVRFAQLGGAIEELRIYPPGWIDFEKGAPYLLLLRDGDTSLKCLKVSDPWLTSPIATDGTVFGELGTKVTLPAFRASVKEYLKRDDARRYRFRGSATATDGSRLLWGRELPMQAAALISASPNDRVRPSAACADIRIHVVEVLQEPDGTALGRSLLGTEITASVNLISERVMLPDQLAAMVAGTDACGMLLSRSGDGDGAGVFELVFDESRELWILVAAEFESSKFESSNSALARE